jgi:hypothetical protein
MIRQVLFGLAALAVLAGCSNDGSQDLRRAWTAVKAVTTRDAPAQDPRDVLTPDLLAKQTQPLLSARLTGRGQNALLRPGAGGPKDGVLWTTLDGTATLAMTRGVLGATRGVVDDLMSSDLDQVLTGIYGGQPRAVRLMRHLDGEDQLRLSSFVCDYSRRADTADTLRGRFSATLITEDCASPDRRIVNKYWIDRKGVMRKSRQWLSPSVGYLETERLVD